MRINLYHFETFWENIDVYWHFRAPINMETDPLSIKTKTSLFHIDISAMVLAPKGKIISTFLLNHSRANSDGSDYKTGID